jgi:uncharacterized membrane protein
LKDLFLNYWALLSDKAFELSSYYGVDPLIFSLLYVGTIPLLWFSIAWIVRNFQKKLPVTVPVVITFLCYAGTYIYLVIAGQNIPVWVYCIAVGMIAFSGYKIQKKVSAKLNQTGLCSELKSGNTEFIRR